MVLRKYKAENIFIYIIVDKFDAYYTNTYNKFGYLTTF